MIILSNIVFFLEFLFLGYCKAIYFSALMEKKVKNHTIIFLFLCISIIEYILYFILYIVALNIAIDILFLIILSCVCFKAKTGICILHSCLLSGIFAMIELMTVPIVNYILQDNYIDSHQSNSEIMISTISKLLFFIVCKIINRIAQKESDGSSSIWLFAVPLVSIICEISIYYLFDNNINIEKYNIVLSAISVSLLFVNIIVFGVHENYIRIAEQVRKMNLSEQKKELDYEYYKLLEFNYKQSKVLIHDIRHHINVLRGIADNGKKEELIEYIDSLSEQEYFQGNRLVTGNKILDIILYQKSKQCEKLNIKFTLKHNNINLMFLDESDLCCILANLLDNAIESAKKTKKTKEKYIFIELYQKIDTDLYFIEISNSCDNSPNIKENRLVTTKKNTKCHGIGMLSLEITIKKYSGDIMYEYIADKSMFKTLIMLKNKNGNTMTR